MKIVDGLNLIIAKMNYFVISILRFAINKKN